MRLQKGPERSNARLLNRLGEPCAGAQAGLLPLHRSSDLLKRQDALVHIAKRTRDGSAHVPPLFAHARGEGLQGPLVALGEIFDVAELARHGVGDVGGWWRSVVDGDAAEVVAKLLLERVHVAVDKAELFANLVEFTLNGVDVAVIRVAVVSDPINGASS